MRTMILLLISLNLWAQTAIRTEDHQVKTFDVKEGEALSVEIDKNAEQVTDSKSKKLLNKISERLKDPTAYKKFARSMGKGSTFLAVHTLKPFIQVSSFATGFFEKPEKNQDVVGLYKFLLKHQVDLDPLVKESATPEEFATMISLKIEDIILEKTAIISKDIIKKVLPNVVIPENLEDLDLSNVDLSEIDLDKLDPALVNDHPEYADIKFLLGDLTQEELIEMIEIGGISKEADSERLLKALPKIHELSAGLFGQLVIPGAVLGAFVSGLGAVYTVPVIAADVGALISALVCTQKEIDDKFLKDEDLKKFCSYVTNWSSYELMKSRMKGYNAGKKLKPKYKEMMLKIKTKIKNQAQKVKKLKRVKKKAEPEVQLNQTNTQAQAF